MSIEKKVDEIELPAPKRLLSVKLSTDNISQIDTELDKLITDYEKLSMTLEQKFKIIDRVHRDVTKLRPILMINPKADASEECTILDMLTDYTIDRAKYVLKETFASR